METKTIEVVKKDRTGFKSTDGNWYANKFKKFDLIKGQIVEIELNSKGFLENVKVLETPKEIPKRFEQQSKRKEASMCVSYAKDLAVAGHIKVEEIAQKAKGFMCLIEELAFNKIEEPKEALTLEAGLDEDSTM